MHLLSPLTNLLIIEDNTICQTLYHALFKEKARVDLVSTAQRAEHYANRRHYDCILTDIGLPDNEDEQLITRLKRSRYNRYTPILIISGHVDEALKQQCLRAGANEVYLKPLPLQQILQRVSILIGNQH